ncbi:MAG: DUF2780 domain-containing protein [Ignavibacteria bacterium]|nr:DUF2780 domain-containing protein [Ignavibacteria bacterium]
MKNLLSSATLIALTLIFLSGCSGSKDVKTPSMTNQISKELGLTNSQTDAGLGAMMMLSKDKLSADDYSKLNKSIPGGGDNYINKATNLGVLPGSVGTTADVVKVLTKLGVSPVQAAKFTGTVLKFTGSLGGSTFGLLSKVF